MLESYGYGIVLVFSQALIILTAYKLARLYQGNLLSPTIKIIFPAAFSAIALHNASTLLGLDYFPEVIPSSLLNLITSGLAQLYLLELQSRGHLKDSNRLKQELESHESSFKEIYRRASIGTFSGRIAHNLSNMLTITLANVDMLRMKLGNDTPSDKHLARIQESANNARILLNRIVAFSVAKPNPDSIDPIQTILEEFTALMQQILPSSVVLNYLDDIGPSYVTPHREEIEQILLILLVNAFEATTEMDGVILISATFEQERGQDFLILGVCDNGRGIDQAIRDRIFAPGFSTKNTGSNNGFGLAIAASIAEDIDGEITLVQDKKVGCCFNLRLHCRDVRRDGAP